MKSMAAVLVGCLLLVGCHASGEQRTLERADLTKNTEDSEVDVGRANLRSASETGKTAEDNSPRPLIFRVGDTLKCSAIFLATVITAPFWLPFALWSWPKC